MCSRHCNKKLPSREDVTGVIIKGDSVANITNGDKFSNWSWWIGVSPSCKSTVFTRPGFHVSVWLYIAIANISYFLVFFSNGEVIDPNGKIRSIENIDKFSLRLLTWLMAGFVGNVVMVYYFHVRSKVSEMVTGLDAFVDGISISIDYNSPRAAAFLNDLYGAVTIAHYALARASANTKYKLQNDELEAIFDDHGYDGKVMTSYTKKGAIAVGYSHDHIAVMRRAILRSIEEEKESSESCLKKSYNIFREENIRLSLTQFVVGASKTMAAVASNKLPFAYVHLIIWATRVFLLLHIILKYSQHALEHLEMESKAAFSCFDSSFALDGIDDPYCVTEEFIFFNVVNILAVYFLMGTLELYPTLRKTWQSQLRLDTFKLVLDLICEPLKPEAGKPKNLSEMKKKS
jgi:hypothetical protein